MKPAVFGSAAVLGITLAVTPAAAATPAGEPPPIATASVELVLQPEEDQTPPVIVDRLAPATVLTIRASGFPPDITGAVEQCVNGPERRCANRLAVRLDDGGAATFQYLVFDDAVADGDEPCRLGESPCTIELSVGDTSSVLDTVFVDEAPPPGLLVVTPRTQLQPGDTVTVAASSFPPR